MLPPDIVDSQQHFEYLCSLERLSLMVLIVIICMNTYSVISFARLSVLEPYESPVRPVLPLLQATLHHILGCA